ncbi:MAG TPA: FG-GAP-like repeat-containing protein [Chloroflexia bacterium]|nr:FG-GAP-like repeat-containing protein [Chloroflexia bacterium]
MANHPTTQEALHRRGTLQTSLLLLGAAVFGAGLLGTVALSSPVNSAAATHVPAPNGGATRLITATAAFHDSTPLGWPALQETTTSWGDYDNDGRLDLLLTGQPSSTFITRLYHNDGGGQFTDATPAGFPGVGRGAGVWGDYDNDGLIDLILTGLTSSSTITRVYHNDGAGAFHTVTPAGLPGLDFSTAAWGDYDNDGRLDFIVSGYAGSLATNITRLYHNDGGNAFHDATPSGLPGFSSGSIAWGDYDNDGRVDLLFTGEGNAALLAQVWHNDGGGAFHNATPAGLPHGDYGSVGWGDYDNDGLLDFVLTGAGGTPLGKIYHNDGGGVFHDATPANVLGVFLGSLAWGDYDADGRLDLLIMGSRYNGLISRLYHNEGGGQFTDVTPVDLPPLQTGMLSWGDYDGDGRLDFAIGGRNASNAPVTRLYHNDGPAANTPPSAPGALTASDVTTSSVVLGWGAAIDPETTSSGLSYNLRVGTTPGGADVVGPMANTGVLTETDGLRRVPALGPARPSLATSLGSLLPGRTYYWSVQAIDPAWAGGPFATEGQFTTVAQGTPTPGPSVTATATPPAATATPPAATATPPVPTATAPPAATVTPLPASPSPVPTAPATATTRPPSATSTPPAATATPCAASFSDVYPADYFYTPVLYLACHGVLSGYADGSFRPYANTTRAQMVKIVVLGFNKPIQTPAGGAYTFADVPLAYPFFAYVETAAAVGIVGGYACGGPGEPCDPQNRPYFRPAADVTRGQLAKIDAVAAGWSLIAPAAATFVDVLPGSPFYTYVETVACHGVVSGYADGTFRPGNSATRGQIAKIVYLSLTAMSCAP